MVKETLFTEFYGDKKYTHVNVCEHQKEHLEPWLKLWKVLNED